MDYKYNIGTIVGSATSIFTDKWDTPTIGVITKRRIDRAELDNEDPYEEDMYYVQWQDDDEGWFKEEEIDGFVNYLEEMTHV